MARGGAGSIEAKSLCPVSHVLSFEVLEKALPLLQLLLLSLFRVLPLNATDGNVASLLYNSLLVVVISSLDKKPQTALIAQCTESLGGLVSAHGVFFAIAKDVLQVGNSSIVARLAQAVGELVLQQSRGRGETSSDSIDSRDGVGRARDLRGQVLERKEGAEASGQRFVLGCKGLAQSEDGGVTAGDLSLFRRDS